MEVIKTKLDGVVIIEPKIFGDARGYFFESFSQREFEEKVRKINFVQDNESMSSYGVMRGLHFQRPPFTQSKLVRCERGSTRCSSRYPQGIANLRTTCCCRTHRRQSSSIFRSERLCSWLCSLLRECYLPVQVRQFLCTSCRWWYLYRGREPWNRLEDSYR